MGHRQDILDLFAGHKPDRKPSFSGLIHVTAGGLQSEGLDFHETHQDPQKMAAAAASTFKLSGFPSAVVPLDLYVEAEALGATIDFRVGEEFSFPQVRKPGFDSAKALSERLRGSSSPQSHSASPMKDFRSLGRIGLVCDAIGQLKKDIGNQAVIGAMLPGPYTLLLLVVDAARMFVEMKKEPQVVADALAQLSSLLAKVGTAYRNAGADFITVHDMGGSPAFIGPAKYERFVLPAEKSLMQNLSGPRVLSVCGNVTGSLHLLSTSGADAISLDQTVDLSVARSALGDRLLFGNLDPVALLFEGDQARVRAAVIGAQEAGVDAVWPGCDLVIRTPIENIRTMNAA